MNNRPSRSSLRSKIRSSRSRNEKGITLVTTLLLLLLLVGMSLTMVLAVSSESLINTFYGRYRGSFYAADSGVAAGRQRLMNLLGANVTVGFNAAVSPIASPVTAGANAALSLATSYPSTFTHVSSSGSWQERFMVKNVYVAQTPFTLAATCSVQGGEPAGTFGTSCANPIPNVSLQNNYPPITAYVYTFPYSMTVVGQSQGSEVATITDSGTIIVTAATSPPAYNQSFAGWGMFIGTYALCSADLVPGTITGPVFTNGSWNFSNSGPYSFTDSVGQVGAQAGWDNGGCVASATPTNGIRPAFNGFNVSQNAIPLPANSFNQEQAVLDGIGNTTTAPSNTTLNGALKNAAGLAYPTGGASTGVYVPYSVSGSPAVKTFTGGGIYVEGSAGVKLAPGSNATSQVYTITQGSVITTITIDPAAGSAGTTTIVTNSGSGAGTQVINGVPQQFSSAGVSQGDATMLYVDGAISSLAGPGQGQAAIQNGTALTVVASGNNNITVTGDILYKTEPVTMTGNLSQIDQLIPANDTGQVLGIFTSGGNVQLQNGQANTNLEIDASIATISQTGSGGIVNTGASIGTLTIVGGRIQNTIQNIGATTRNVLFDRRFLNGFAPPWFPSTTVTPKTGVGAAATVTWKGTQWVNQTNYQ
jgi:Tfp pilus assembly protein PilX